MPLFRIRVSPSGPIQEIDVPDLPLSSDDVTDESAVTSGGTLTQALTVLLNQPPPSSGPAIVLTSNLVSAWVVNTPLPDDDFYTPLSQFIVGSNERNPFLVASVNPFMSGGNGANAFLFGVGTSPGTLLIDVDLALEVTFSSGVGQCILTPNLFDDLGTQLTFSGGIFTGPTSQLLRYHLSVTVDLGSSRLLALKFKKNDQDATVISGVNLLGCSAAVSLVTP